eukprot:8714399-Heterocapsa_arctica.AAC.1
MLQELHGNDADTVELERLLPGHMIVATYIANVAAGGVAILLGPKILGAYPIILSSRVLEAGRSILVEVTDEGKHPLAFCAVHVVPEWTDPYNKDFLNKVRDALPNVGSAFSFLEGDFNVPSM